MLVTVTRNTHKALSTECVSRQKAKHCRSGDCLLLVLHSRNERDTNVFCRRHNEQRVQCDLPLRVGSAIGCQLKDTPPENDGEATMTWRSDVLRRGTRRTCTSWSMRVFPVCTNWVSYTQRNVKNPKELRWLYSPQVIWPLRLVVAQVKQWQNLLSQTT